MILYPVEWDRVTAPGAPSLLLVVGVVPAPGLHPGVLLLLLHHQQGVQLLLAHPLVLPGPKHKRSQQIRNNNGEATK